MGMKQTDHDIATLATGCGATRAARARRDHDPLAPRSDGDSSRTDRTVRFERAASRESRFVVTRELRPTGEYRGARDSREHERDVVSPAIQSGDRHEPSAVSENAPAAGGAAPHADRDARRRTSEPPRRLLERVAVHSRVRPLLRKCAHERHPSVARTGDCPVRQLGSRASQVHPTENHFAEEADPVVGVVSHRHGSLRETW